MWRLYLVIISGLAKTSHLLKKITTIDNSGISCTHLFFRHKVITWFKGIKIYREEIRVLHRPFLLKEVVKFHTSSKKSTLSRGILLYCKWNKSKFSLHTFSSSPFKNMYSSLLCRKIHFSLERFVCFRYKICFMQNTVTAGTHHLGVLLLLSSLSRGLSIPGRIVFYLLWCKSQPSMSRVCSVSN